jgi:hypothetical protein
MRALLSTALFTVFATISLAISAQGMFFAKPHLPAYSAHSAETNRWCDAADSGASAKQSKLCTQRVVLEVEHGRYVFTRNEAPACIKGAETFPWPKLSSDVAADAGSSAAFAFDFAKAVAEKATGFGMLRGEVGKWLHTYGNDAARCVVVGVRLPDSATFKDVNPRVFDPVKPELGWSSCNEQLCSALGWCGWDQRVEKRGDIVGGVFKNWLHDGRRFILVDVRYYE